MSSKASGHLCIWPQLKLPEIASIEELIKLNDHRDSDKGISDVPARNPV
jgi:hypothetical protein